MKNKLNFKALSDIELVNKMKELREEIFKLRFDLMLGKLKKVHLLKSKKRDLARVLTEINIRLKQKLLSGEQNGKEN